MSLIPVWQIGVWNAWILQALLFLAMAIAELLEGKEGKERTKRAMQPLPFGKAHKLMAYSTHVVIMPITVVYSIFLPLKLGTGWLYSGLAIFALGLVLSVMATHSFATTPIGEPVTGGIYRVSRHPVYLSGFLAYLGIGLAGVSWVMLLCAVLWILLWCLVVPAEERFLVERYGEAYREYMRRTPRWIGRPGTG